MLTQLLISFTSPLKNYCSRLGGGLDLQLFIYVQLLERGSDDDFDGFLHIVRMRTMK